MINSIHTDMQGRPLFPYIDAGAFQLVTQNPSVAATAISLALGGGSFPVTTRAYVCGFQIIGNGATAGSTIDVTLAGLGVVMNFPLVIPTGVGVQVLYDVYFSVALPAASLNPSQIVLTVPSFGAGNTKAAASLWGFNA